jgi:methyl-accepting chemotaxis protein
MFSLRGKLYLSFASMALMSLLTGAWSYLSASQIRAQYQQVSTQHLPAATQLLQLQERMEQCLVAERSLLFLKQNSPDAVALRQQHAEALKQISEMWVKYSSIPCSSEESAQRKAFQAAHETWEKNTTALLKTLEEDTPAARRDAIDDSMGANSASFTAATGILKQLSAARQNSLEASSNELNALAAGVRTLAIVFVCAAALVGAVLGFGLGRRLVGPLDRAIRSLDHGVQQVAAGAQQVAAASREFSQDSAAQAAAVTESSASLAQMAAMTQRNCEHAANARALAAKAQTSAGEGNAVMTEMSLAIEDIRNASVETGKILRQIDEIAFQTNILALNAAVEAARAGDAGRGFAVVADEVRSLAQRSAEAARESAKKIEATMEKSSAGVETSKRVEAALQAITLQIRDASALVSKIADASNEQSQGITQINAGVKQVDAIGQSNAVRAQQSAAAAEEMSQQARQASISVDELAFLLNGARRQSSESASKTAAIHTPRIAQHQGASA